MIIMSKKTIKSELLPKKWTIAFHPLTGGSLGNSETGKKERVYDGNIKIRIFQLLLNVSGSGPLWSNVHHYSSGLIILLRLAELREPFCRVNQRNCNLIIMRIWLSMTTIDALTARLKMAWTCYDTMAQLWEQTQLLTRGGLQRGRQAESDESRAFMTTSYDERELVPRPS